MSKKMSHDEAADFASSESLSFAGLVCIHDQLQLTCQSENLLPTTLGKEGPKVQKEDPEFEFSSSIAGSIIGSPNNNLSADKLFLNGQLSTKISSNQHQVPKQIRLEDLCSPIPGHRRRSDMNQSNSKSSRKQISEVKRRANEKPTAGKRSLSQKLFSSFATPCRDCRTHESTAHVKQQTLQ